MLARISKKKLGKTQIIPYFIEVVDIVQKILNYFCSIMVLEERGMKTQVLRFIRSKMDKFWRNYVQS